MKPPLNMLIGPAIWGAHFLLCYALLSVGCALGWPSNALRWSLGALTALALTWLGCRLVVAGRSANDFHARVGRGLDLLALIAVLWLGAALPLVPAACR